MLDKKKLAVTGFSTVCKARNKKTGEDYAVKTVLKMKRKIGRCSNEISILRMMDHPNIVKLHETFEDDRAVRLVMELCFGGELSDRIIQEQDFSEAKAATVLKQIFSAVDCLHSQQVCHRDIKPENLLFKDRKPIGQSVLKLLDFDQSKEFKDNKFMRTRVGNYLYSSPQVLSGKYDHSCDLWSCGVIMHVLLVGYPPFYGESEADVIQRIKKGIGSLDAKDWSQVSDKAQELVKMLMKFNPRERCTAKQALDHEWLNIKSSEVEVKVAPRTDVIDNLKSFVSRSRSRMPTKVLELDGCESPLGCDSPNGCGLDLDNLPSNLQEILSNEQGQDAESFD